MAGERLTKLCLESIQFDVDPVLVGGQCPSLTQLSVINARVSLGRQKREAGNNEPLFPRLTQLYLYLVQYLPAIDMQTRSVTTGESHRMMLTSGDLCDHCRTAPAARPGPWTDQCPVPGLLSPH